MDVNFNNTEFVYNGHIISFAQHRDINHKIICEEIAVGNPKTDKWIIVFYPRSQDWNSYCDGMLAAQQYIDNVNDQAQKEHELTQEGN